MNEVQQRKTQGGQAGHQGHGRRLKLPGQVRHTVVVKPVACAHCGTLLLGDDLQPECHQVEERA